MSVTLDDVTARLDAMQAQITKIAKTVEAIARGTTRVTVLDIEELTYTTAHIADQIEQAERQRDLDEIRRSLREAKATGRVAS